VAGKSAIGGRSRTGPTLSGSWWKSWGADGCRLHFCYEAGPCGYGLHRQLVELGHDCIVVAPSLIPVKAGDRVKTDRRDAAMLAKLNRAGELTAVWVPDAAHETMRDLVRARATAVRVAGKARQHLQGFLLRHGRIYPGKKGWTKAYRHWLTTVRFEHLAQQIVLQDYIHSVTDAEVRIERLTKQIADLRREAGCAVIFITHDIAVVRRVADRVLVLRHGQAVETGPVAEVLNAPRHPYTRRLAEAATTVPRRASETVAGGAPAVSVENLRVTFPAAGGFRRPARFTAVDGVWSAPWKVVLPEVGF
jgi:transposase